MKSLEVINDTMTVDVFIYELMQYGADAPGTLDTPNARVVINAKNCRIDPDRADEGVWLERADAYAVARATRRVKVVIGE